MIVIHIKILECFHVRVFWDYCAACAKDYSNSYTENITVDFQCFEILAFLIMCGLFDFGNGVFVFKSFFLCVNEPSFGVKFLCHMHHVCMSKYHVNKNVYLLVWVWRFLICMRCCLGAFVVLHMFLHRWVSGHIQIRSWRFFHLALLSLKDTCRSFASWPGILFVYIVYL